MESVYQRPISRCQPASPLLLRAFCAIQEFELLRKAARNFHLYNQLPNIDLASFVFYEINSVKDSIQLTQWYKRNYAYSPKEAECSLPYCL